MTLKLYFLCSTTIQMPPISPDLDAPLELDEIQLRIPPDPTPSQPTLPAALASLARDPIARPFIRGASTGKPPPSAPSSALSCSFSPTCAPATPSPSAPPWSKPATPSAPRASWEPSPNASRSHARPAWLTGLTVWFALPATLLTAQFFVHRAFGTPQLKASMIGSFCFAALGTGFNWFGHAPRRHVSRKPALGYGTPLLRRRPPRPPPRSSGPS